jgi:hypothetical protein
VSARQCPNCMAIVPAWKIASYSNDLVCTGCGRPLGISAFSRNISAFAGLAAGALVWRISFAHYAGNPGSLGWLLPIVFAYLALSVVAPIVLILLADLHLREVEAPPEIHQAPAHHPSR